MKYRYVLISPVRNEDAFIEQTIQSIVQQTILPERWVIVNDNSTDRTEEIVIYHAAHHPFIELVNVSGDSRRNFGSKARAIAIGAQSLESLDYDFVGNLDGDISLEPDYYERILKLFEANPRLGIAGGVIMDCIEGRYVRSISSLKHTAGAIQLFRRECYESIGGYRPLRHGGIDSYAAISARMMGWETRTFVDIPVYHLRPSSTAGRSLFGARLYEGRRDYFLGDDPLFALIKSIRRVAQRPVFLGSVARYVGFLRPMLSHEPREVSQAFIDFRRHEQWGKLGGLLGSIRRRDHSSRKPSAATAKPDS